MWLRHVLPALRNNQVVGSAISRPPNTAAITYRTVGKQQRKIAVRMTNACDNGARTVPVSGGDDGDANGQVEQSMCPD